MPDLWHILAYAVIGVASAFCGTMAAILTAEWIRRRGKR